MPLSELCPKTNQPHGNAWSCGSCFATTTRTEPCTESRRPESRRPESRRPESRRPEPRRPEPRRPEPRRPEPRRTEPRRTEIEVIDLLDSSPPASPSPQKAIHVFATPSKQSSTRERFKHYNRTDGAEDYRQESITHTRTLGIQGTNVNVQFHLLVRKRINGILKPLSCDLLGMFV